MSVKTKNQVRSPGGLPGCPSKPPLVERPLLGIETAAELARVYETLANDTRIRLLHVLLKEGEIYPSGLAAKLGMKPQAVSNQLQRLLDRGIVQTRRNGNNVFYRVVDPCVIELIDRGLCLLEDTRVIPGPAMNSRLEKVRKLKLDVSEATPAPARRWVLWLLLAIVVAAVAFLALKDTPLRNSVSPTGQGSTAVAAPAAETSAAPTETPGPNRFTAAGYVEPIPPFPIHVSPLVLGRIDEFTITEGQPVKAGQIIAKLNSQEFEKRLAELQAALGVNGERLALAETELARSKKLSSTGAATGKKLEQASADAAVLRAEAAKLQAEIKTVEWQIQQTAVRAPVDGILFERWQAWAVSSIPTRSGKSPQSTIPRSCKYGWT